jgi:hypothetical protein
MSFRVERSGVEESRGKYFRFRHENVSTSLDMTSGNNKISGVRDLASRQAAKRRDILRRAFFDYFPR